MDSRSSFPVPAQRPIAPSQQIQQQRPQFQTGGPVNNPPQFAARPGTPVPRNSLPAGPQQAPVPRPQVPQQRPSGPQSLSPQQPLRPQHPPVGQALPRAPPPNNLQFGPRQHPQLGGPPTPDGSKSLTSQQPNVGIRNGVPSTISKPTNQPVGQFPRQPSQSSIKSSDPSSPTLNKEVKLENQSVINDNHNVHKPETGMDISGVPKNRSYSISAAPGAPSPLKLEDDRRKSISGIGGKIEEFGVRAPGLGLIQEGKVDIKETGIRDSKENIRSEALTEGREVPDRSESRLSSSKMSESFISYAPSTPKKKLDDDDDVILQNNKLSAKPPDSNKNANKTEISDRSPSLTRSDDSPEPKQQPASIPINKTIPKTITPEPQRPKTPNAIKANDINKDIKPPFTPVKSPVSEQKPSTPIAKKPTELYTSTPIDSKKSTPRKSASASKTRAKGKIIDIIDIKIHLLRRANSIYIFT